MEYCKFNNGVRMSMVGLGTYGLPNKDMKNILSSAFDLGYNRIDTAWKYNNEKTIGVALKELGIPRDEVFIISKLHLNDLYLNIKGHRIPYLHIPTKTIKKSFEQSCKRLKTDYLDLYILHWPFPNYEYMWEEVSKIYEEGRVRAIGVTYFTEKHLDNLKRVSDIIPAYNQIELSPYNTNKELIPYCQNRGIHVEGYSTFGVGRTNVNADVDLLKNPVILDIANKYEKSSNQIILRWVVQQSVSVIPRSKNSKHQKENIEIFDFELSDTEMQAIDTLNQGKYAWFNPYKGL